MANFRFTLSIGISNAEHEDIVEIPDEDLEGLSEEDREAEIESWWKDWSGNYIDGGWDEVDE